MNIKETIDKNLEEFDKLFRILHGTGKEGGGHRVAGKDVRASHGVCRAGHRAPRAVAAGRHGCAFRA